MTKRRKRKKLIPDDIIQKAARLLKGGTLHKH